MKKQIIISKYDAAKRQLEMAIRLYFSNGDPIPIHTLTAASYNIIRDINIKIQGDPMMCKDLLLNMVKPEHKNYIWKKITQAENFLKHADRDHEDLLKFNPDLNEVLMLDACMVYQRISGEQPPLFKIYMLWFLIHHQEYYNLSSSDKELIAGSGFNFETLSREVYFSDMLILTMRVGT